MEFLVLIEHKRYSEHINICINVAAKLTKKQRIEKQTNRTLECQFLRTISPTLMYNVIFLLLFFK